MEQGRNIVRQVKENTHIASRSCRTDSPPMTPKIKLDVGGGRGTDS
jgi:hypothetical protein